MKVNHGGILALLQTVDGVAHRLGSPAVIEISEGAGDALRPPQVVLKAFEDRAHV